jgi:hypothetical protein
VSVPTEVFLQAGKTPRFPDNCVVCRTPMPGDSISVTRRPATLSTLYGVVGHGLVIDAPACPPCGKVLMRRYHLEAFATVGTGIVGAIAAVLLGQLLQISPKWLWLPVVGGAGAAYVILHYRFPPAFDFSFENRLICYEFRDPDYAAVFATLNRIA